MADLKVYVALVEDRHTGPDVQLFTDKNAAIQWAHDAAVEYARDWPITDELAALNVRPTGPLVLQFPLRGKSCHIHVVERTVSEEVDEVLTTTIHPAGDVSKLYPIPWTPACDPSDSEWWNVLDANGQVVVELIAQDLAVRIAESAK